MVKEKTSKRDEYLERVKSFAAYVDSNENVVGIYATNEDCLIANKSIALKKLQSLFNYKIQMVIK